MKFFCVLFSSFKKKRREEFITPPEIDRSGAAIVEFDRALLLFSGQIRSAMFDGTTNRL